MSSTNGVTQYKSTDQGDSNSQNPSWLSILQNGISFLIRTDKVNLYQANVTVHNHYHNHNAKKLYETEILFEFDEKKYTAIEIPYEQSRFSKFYRILSSKNSPFSHIASLTHTNGKYVLLTPNEYVKWSIVHFPIHFIGNNLGFIKSVFAVFFIGLCIKR